MAVDSKKDEGEIDVDQRRDAALKRALTTPHNPHVVKKPAKKAPKKKPAKD